MSIMVQKKITFRKEQEAFLARYKEFGYADQSSVVRTALDALIKEIERARRRERMRKKAQALFEVYAEDKELTAFAAIDGDPYYEAG